MPKKLATLSEDEKKQKFFALNLIFVIKIKHKSIKIPAIYCGIDIYTKIKRVFKKEKFLSHHFCGEDLICPKDYKGKKVLFLGPAKVKPGMPISYPPVFSDARNLEIKKKYKVYDIQRRR
jgi:hypothetical protein